MTPEERAVLSAALKWHKTLTDRRSHIVSHAAQERLKKACQALRISDQPEHTVEPIPCGVYANHSATMSCVLPKGHRGSVPFEEKYQFTHHSGYPGGVRNAGPNGGMRQFTYSPYYETMETHERAACARFPGCERHP